MTPEAFSQLMHPITRQIAGKPLDAALEQWLNRNYGAESSVFKQIQAACEAGIAAGWMCAYEGGGLRYGRVAKPSPALDNFSIDVVDMRDVAGPHHVHPLGEIDLIMPLEGAAVFDGRPAGWCVYPAGSAHSPTVSGGRALVLYLLPAGQIQFTRTAV